MQCFTSVVSALNMLKCTLAHHKMIRRTNTSLSQWELLEQIYILLFCGPMQVLGATGTSASFHFKQASWISRLLASHEEIVMSIPFNSQGLASLVWSEIITRPPQEQDFTFESSFTPLYPPLQARQTAFWSCARC